MDYDHICEEERRKEIFEGNSGYHLSVKYVVNRCQPQILC